MQSSPSKTLYELVLVTELGPAQGVVIKNFGMQDVLPDERLVRYIESFLCFPSRDFKKKISPPPGLRHNSKKEPAGE